MELRLVYFDFPFWRAEPIRIALQMAGIPFEDVRPDYKEFARMKAAGELPYGQLPVLDVDGVRLAQSLAMARFCGKLAGLYPADDPILAARCDELMDTVTQVTYLMQPSMREKDSERKRAMRQALAEDTVPRWLDYIEQRLAMHDAQPFLTGGQLTIADLILWRFCGWLIGGVIDGFPDDLLDPHPKLSGLYRAVDALPAVQACMARYKG